MYSTVDQGVRFTHISIVENLCSSMVQFQSRFRSLIPSNSMQEVMTSAAGWGRTAGAAGSEPPEVGSRLALYSYSTLQYTAPGLGRGFASRPRPIDPDLQ